MITETINQNKILDLSRSALRNWRYLVPFAKRLGYVGWLDYGNLGDEAMYVAFQKLFSSYTVLPFKTSKKIELMDRSKLLKSYEAVCLGGGSLINSDMYFDVFSAAQRNYTKSFVLGSGVRNPEFWTGRLKSGDPKLEEWTACLNRCGYVGVRGPLSLEMLQRQGFNRAEVVGDLALLLAQENVEPKVRAKRVAINIGTDGHLWGSEEGVLDFVVSLSKILMDKGHKITLLPFWHKNTPYIEEAARRMGGNVEIFRNYRSLSATMEFLKGCDFFIGEKLHSVILACCVYTPSIMLAYRTKCLDFMAAMGLEKFCMRTDQLSLDKAMDLVSQISSETEIYQGKIKAKIDYYKKVYSEAREKIIKELNSQN